MIQLGRHGAPQRLLDYLDQLGSVSDRHSVASQPNRSALATMFVLCGLKAISLPLVTRTTRV